VISFAGASLADAQTPPNKSEIRAYKGLHAAVVRGDLDAVVRLVAAKAPIDERDAQGRTPLHVAAHGGHLEIAWALVKGGADPKALDHQKYDIVTIAAVRDDLAFVSLALDGGADAKAITSPYDGTALIAAAHLGHHRIVQRLIAAKAPLEHVNNIAMTALIEAIVLGDGGAKHQATVETLLRGGADPNNTGGKGMSPLALARSRGYGEIARMLETAGGR
jgi:ankyrin repeat protein